MKLLLRKSSPAHSTRATRIQKHSGLTATAAVRSVNHRAATTRTTSLNHNISSRQNDIIKKNNNNNHRLNPVFHHASIRSCSANKTLRDQVTAPWGTKFGRSRLGTPPFQFQATKTQALNPFAKRHVELRAMVAEREDGFALVKPETYLVTANLKSIIPAIRYFNTTSDAFTFLYPEPKLQVGEFATSSSGDITGEALETIANATQTQLFRRLGVGIGYSPHDRMVLPAFSHYDRSNRDLEKWFLYNKMPEKDLKVVEKNVLGDMERLMEIIYDLSTEQTIRLD